MVSMVPTVARSSISKQVQKKRMRQSMIFKFFLCLQSAALAASFLQSSPVVTPFFRSKPQFPSSLSVSATASASSIEHENGPIGIYVHIPYCRRRCRYCSFAIVPIGPNVVTDLDSTKQDAATDTDTATEISNAAQLGFAAMNQNYTTALLKEISYITTQQQQSPDKKKIPLQSIYFGGGTPSLAPVETLEQILDAIRAVDGPFLLQEDAEISIEMDPGTFSKEKLQSIKDMGFNRISLGVQSFDDRILESIGRVHKVLNVWESLAMLQDVYGEELSYSLDLISGLPGLSLAQWTETLHTAIHLQPRPSHLSIYDLQIEGGTVFGKWYDSDRESTFQQTKGEPPVSALALPSEEQCAFMYKYAAGYLRSKGYEHYEISSYALLQDSGPPSPKRSRHNQIYWATDSQWYAVGLGATSFVGGGLTARPRTMADYIDWVEQQEALPESKATPVEDFDLLTDVVLKRLRTSEGLSLEWVARRFDEGESHVASILRGAQLGLDLGLVTLEDDVLRLVDSTGFLYSNSIISSIFAELGVGEVDS